MHELVETFSSELLSFGADEKQKEKREVFIIIFGKINTRAKKNFDIVRVAQQVHSSAKDIYFIPGEMSVQKKI